MLKNNEHAYILAGMTLAHCAAKNYMPLRGILVAKTGARWDDPTVAPGHNGQGIAQLCVAGFLFVVASRRPERRGPAYASAWCGSGCTIWKTAFGTEFSCAAGPHDYFDQRPGQVWPLRGTAATIFFG